MAKPHIKLPKLTPQRIARFERRVKKCSDGECWLWQGYRDQDGYGVVSLVIDEKERHIRAHRIAYFLHTGIDPLELIVCHHCDNPPCANPNHLFIGTPADNTQDRVAKGRSMKGDTHYFHLRPESVPKGEGHGMAKLTEAQVLEIRRDADRFSRYELAKRYKVNKRMIQFIIQRKNWTHI